MKHFLFAVLAIAMLAMVIHIPVVHADMGIPGCQHATAPSGGMATPCNSDGTPQQPAGTPVPFYVIDNWLHWGNNGVVANAYSPYPGMYWTVERPHISFTFWEAPDGRMFLEVTIDWSFPGTPPTKEYYRVSG